MTVEEKALFHLSLQSCHLVFLGIYSCLRNDMVPEENYLHGDCYQMHTSALLLFVLTSNSAFYGDIDTA
jgi:hypothetical protein